MWAALTAFFATILRGLGLWKEERARQEGKKAQLHKQTEGALHEIQIAEGARLESQLGRVVNPDSLWDDDGFEVKQKRKP